MQATSGVLASGEAFMGAGGEGGLVTKGDTGCQGSGGHSNEERGDPNELPGRRLIRFARIISALRLKAISAQWRARAKKRRGWPSQGPRAVPGKGHRPRLLDMLTGPPGGFGGETHHIKHPVWDCFRSERRGSLLFPSPSPKCISLS